MASSAVDGAAERGNWKRRETKQNKIHMHLLIFTRFADATCSNYHDAKRLLLAVQAELSQRRFWRRWVHCLHANVLCHVNAFRKMRSIDFFGCATCAPIVPCTGTLLTDSICENRFITVTLFPHTTQTKLNFSLTPWQLIWLISKWTKVFPILIAFERRRWGNAHTRYGQRALCFEILFECTTFHSNRITISN